MTKLKDRIGPTDIIALTIIIGGFYLVAQGINSLVGTMLTAVTFFYFGEKLRQYKDESDVIQKNTK